MGGGRGEGVGDRERMGERMGEGVSDGERMGEGGCDRE